MSVEDRLLLETSRFRVVELDQPGRDGRPHTRQIVRHPGAVVIVPLLSDGRLCLIRNYRVAVDDTLIELPAGTLEPGEAHGETARRELLEETGLRSERFTHLHTFFTSPGICDEAMYVYLAEDCTEGEAEREAGELIENHIVSWEEALAQIDRGEIRDGKTIAAILLAARRFD